MLNFYKLKHALFHTPSFPVLFAVPSSNRQHCVPLLNKNFCPTTETTPLPCSQYGTAATPTSVTTKNWKPKSKICEKSPKALKPARPPHRGMVPPGLMG